MKSSGVLLLVWLSCYTAFTQDQLPFYEISESGDNYSAGTLAARMIDGLGFRYRWATDSLRQADLDYRPGAEARSTFETVVHIYQLSIIIINATTSSPNQFPDTKSMTFELLRKRTLENLQIASANLRTAKDGDFKKFKIILKQSVGTRELPFWNVINGPIADALWHVGQIVSFRRSSGNPFTDRVSVLTGTVNK